MNVVGKVGSLITQGVYSVATPFHPFGGAVDIIVVQQQDGTFRSTPWYVQFGKFQGVLKGAEKVVRINVNGVEANFHMYLDNSGEAYFVREAESGQGSEKSQGSAAEKEGALAHSLSIDNSQCNINNDNVEKYRLQSTLSDPGVLREDYSSFRPDQLERNDSDLCRFYDFQDDQSFEGELSPEYGSSRFDNLDTMDNFVEAQGSDSEMVLVSVDGHILTAPITSSEQNTEDVQLVTPQFHLGPGEGNGFCEGDAEFTVTESAWNPGYITDLDASSSKPAAVDASCENNNDQVGTDDGHALEACKGDDECAPKSPEYDGNGDFKGDAYRDAHIPDRGKEHTINVDDGHEVEDMHNFENREEEAHVHQDHDCLSGDVEDLSPGAQNDKFRSCLDLTVAGIDETPEVEDSTVTVRELSIPLEEQPSETDESPNHNEKENVPALAHPDVKVVTGIDIAEDKTDDDSSPSDVHPNLASESLRSVNIAGVEDIYPESPSSGDVSVYKDDRESPVMSHETAKSSAGGDFTETESVRSEGLDVHLRNSFEQEQVQINEGDFAESELSRSEVPSPHIRKSSEQEHANFNPLVEISLCGHLLKPGMGLEAANEVFNSNQISEEEFRSTAVSIAKNDNLVIRYKEKYFLWTQAAHIVLGITAFGVDLSIESKDAIQVEQEVISKPEENDPGSASGRRWRLWPIPFRRVKTVQSSNSSSVEEVFVDSESAQNSSLQLTPTSLSGTPRSTTGSKSPLKRIVRTNIPTNLQIESLNLKEGQNDVTFSFSTRVLGLQQVQAHIYLWKWNARIVISDVDGTITKSDVLGQFMPLVGKDWSQSGVARLFSAIKENGYQLLFLSARAIVQAYLTKSFLFNLKQDGKTLPNGPVVISPNGLFPSLFREVIRRAPHEFKIACLEDIKALFPPDYNPFYAGFGNRDTDELTYRKIGIPKGKIFIINPKGEVAINHQIDVKSYTSLHTLVNDMFPPTSMVEQEDYNSWNYWKMPVQDIDE
ncbi:hypothetical protein RND81_01G079200 [Saponaria officinalis]|uniref:phosphatidate phosphatase n=1 Tax=Saponaria officinalis TaxID=3572 RepID=A0AAW1N6H5_SAPOF